MCICTENTTIKIIYVIRLGVFKTRHTFKEVFDEDSNQKIIFDTTALPLVHDLIHGKNGLFLSFCVYRFYLTVSC